MDLHEVMLKGVLVHYDWTRRIFSYQVRPHLYVVQIQISGHG